MKNRDISLFVRGRQDVNRFKLVCSSGPPLFPLITLFSQLADVARGLCYMHDHGVIHGDLKGVRLSKLKLPLLSLTTFVY